MSGRKTREAFEAALEWRRFFDTARQLSDKNPTIDLLKLSVASTVERERELADAIEQAEFDAQEWF